MAQSTHLLMSAPVFLPKASLLFYIGEIYLTQVHSVKKTAPKASERRRTNCKQRSHAKKNCIQIRLQFFAQIHLEKRLLPVFSSPFFFFSCGRGELLHSRVSFLLCPKWIFYFILIGPYSIYATLGQKTIFCPKMTNKTDLDQTSKILFCHSVYVVFAFVWPKPEIEYKSLFCIGDHF